MASGAVGVRDPNFAKLIPTKGAFMYTPDSFRVNGNGINDGRKIDSTYPKISIHFYLDAAQLY